ncbi:MAG: Transketolase, alpha subunit [Microgenomates group bacterium GW2011_GWA2_47_8]|nr:MAG: Transketolase, alpha subunit [Microgenomates group bacterium GW2011_GWA2_47_8]
MRQAFVQTLIERAWVDPRIILLTGDLGFTVLEPFRDKFPDRFINVGVAEQNLMGIAAGLALTGRIPVAFSIATFATTRPFEQIRNDIARHRLPVVVVGVGGGVAYSDALFTHHALEDIALMRVLPGLTVLSPADPVETKWATKIALSLGAPVYLRLGKSGEPTLYSKPLPRFQLGKGSVISRGRDCAILATGSITSAVLGASELLKKHHIDATVVSMHTIKPIDGGLIRSLARKHIPLVTVEEHFVIGGLGAAVAECLSEEKATGGLLRIGVGDTFVYYSGSHVYVREKIGLSPEGIALKIRRFLSLS